MLFLNTGNQDEFFKILLANKPHLFHKIWWEEWAPSNGTNEAPCVTVVPRHGMLPIVIYPGNLIHLEVPTDAINRSQYRMLSLPHWDLTGKMKKNSFVSQNMRSNKYVYNELWFMQYTKLQCKWIGIPLSPRNISTRFETCATM